MALRAAGSAPVLQPEQCLLGDLALARHFHAGALDLALDNGCRPALKSTFHRLVADGALPGPVIFGVPESWNVEALQKALPGEAPYEAGPGLW